MPIYPHSKVSGQQWHSDSGFSNQARKEMQGAQTITAPVHFLMLLPHPALMWSDVIYFLVKFTVFVQLWGQLHSLCCLFYFRCYYPNIQMWGDKMSWCPPSSGASGHHKAQCHGWFNTLLKM